MPEKSAYHSLFPVTAFAREENQNQAYNGSRLTLASLAPPTRKRKMAAFIVLKRPGPPSREVLVNLDQILMVQPGQNTGSAILFGKEHLVNFEEDLPTVMRQSRPVPSYEPIRAKRVFDRIRFAARPFWGGRTDDRPSFLFAADPALRLPAPATWGSQVRFLFLISAVPHAMDERAVRPRHMRA